MLAGWIFGFMFGVIVARTSPSAAWGRPELPIWIPIAVIILAAASVHLVARWRMQARVLATLVGFFWGLAHTAPTPLRPVKGGEVIASMSRLAAHGPLLVRTPAGVFAGEGAQARGRVLWVWPTTRRAMWLTQPSARVAVRQSARPPVIVTTVRDAVTRRLAALPPTERGLLGAVLMGDKSALSAELRRAFFVTGLLHLLVVSGLHVSLVAQAFALIVAWPARLAYACRWLSPQSWRHLQAGVCVIAAIGAMSYAALVGMNAASHRAAFAFAMMQLTGVFCGSASLALRLQLVLATQILVYPVGLVADATAMSWFAYLIVIEAARPSGRWWQRARSLGAMQLRLVLGSGAFFASLPLLGLIANPLLVPLFPLLLANSVGAVAGVAVAWQLGCIRTFVDWVMLIGQLDEQGITCPVLAGVPLTLCRVAAVATWLNTCRSLSIRRYEDY